MIRCEVLAGRRHREPRGPVAVESRTWGLVLHGRGFAAGVAYGHPSGLRVLDAGRRVRIVDHLMFARLAGAVALLVAHAIRKART